MKNIAWWEWARFKEQKKKERAESKKRTREFAEEWIEWELPTELLPVKSKRFKWGYREYHISWYVNGSDTPQSFVYLLKEQEHGQVRYVGLTDDPPRRHMEHRRDDKIGAPFKMVIVAVGDENTEREWIGRCISNGHILLNVIANKSA